MVRSLLAVVVAVVAGLAVANIVERIGLASPSLPAFGFSAIIVIGWGVAAFIAAAVALLIGVRWAPLGWLAAAAMALQALMGLAGGGLGPLMWLAAPLSAATGGWAAVKLLRGHYRPPRADRDGLDV